MLRYLSYGINIFMYLMTWYNVPFCGFCDAALSILSLQNCWPEDFWYYTLLCQSLRKDPSIYLIRRLNVPYRFFRCPNSPFALDTDPRTEIFVLGLAMPLNCCKESQYIKWRYYSVDISRTITLHLASSLSKSIATTAIL